MERLREIRTGKGMTQKEVAEKAGISLTAYQFYERGERSPTIDTLEKICKVLEVPLTISFDDPKDSGKIETVTDLLKIFVPLFEKSMAFLDTHEERDDYYNLLEKDNCIRFNNDVFYQAVNAIAELQAIREKGVMSLDLYKLAVSGVYEKYSKHKLLDKNTFKGDIPKACEKFKFYYEAPPTQNEKSPAPSDQDETGLD